MFSSPKVPKPEAPPPSPVLAEEQIRARQAEADAATADAALGGRRSTQYAGADMAREKQMERGKRRLLRAGDELL